MNSDPTNALRVTDGFADALQSQHNVLASIAEPRIDRRREAAEDVDNRQHAEFAAGGQLVVNEVHGPGLVDLFGIGSIFSQLGLDAALGRFVA